MKYFDPAIVEEKGTRLSNVPMSQQPSQWRGTLVAVIDKAIFKTAVNVGDPRKYQEFYNQYASGMALNFVLYTLDEATAKEAFRSN